MGKPTNRICILTAVGLFAFNVHAGNLTFWQELNLGSGGPTAGVYWVSLPYAYTPTDTNSNLTLDAEDLVQDFQPANLPHPCTEGAADCAVVRVWQWDSSTGEYSSWIGGSASGSPFTIEPGVAYGIEVQEVTGQTLHTIDLVGAHDPSFEFSDCHTPGAVNMRWISLPPHLAIDTSFGLPGVLDAEDLGQAMGGRDKVFQIRVLSKTTGLYDNWVVGSVYGTPFPIDLSRAYAIDLSCIDLTWPCGECLWDWTPDHY